MQPMLALTSAQEGLVRINGHFAGEVSEGTPLLRPVHPRGALYLEFHPYSDSYRPMARRLVFSGGEPLPESLENSAGLNVLIWPGSVTEIEFSPEHHDIPRQGFSRGGRSFLLEGGTEPKLYCEGSLFSPLPEGAQMPEYLQLRDGGAFIGRCKTGMYLLAADQDFRRPTGFLRAKEITVEDSSIRALLSAGDFAGHASRERWQLLPEGLRLASSESCWEDGAPRHPNCPEDAALAAVEAALLGLHHEISNYLSPALCQSHFLDEIRATCDLCVRMKYAPPGAKPAIGLLSLEGDRLARIRPLYYHAVPADERQGWIIDAFE